MTAPGAATDRLLPAVAALCCGVAIALGAYAAHAAEPLAMARLQQASLYLVLHGIAVIALRPLAPHARLLAVARSMLLLGSCIFAGSLTVGSLSGSTAPLAPLGGSLMILGWFLVAIAMLRRTK